MQYFWGSGPQRFAPWAARVCVCIALQQKESAVIIRRGGARGGGKEKTTKGSSVAFKVFSGGAKQTSNRSAHARDQRYSCSEKKQTQQRGKELTEGAGGEAGDLFFRHVQRGWGWISCIYSVKRGKKRRQKSKASFIAPEKTKIFNKLPIATPSLEKGERKEREKKKKELQVFVRGLYRSHAGN